MRKLTTVLILAGFVVLTAVTGWLVWGTMRPNRSLTTWPGIAARLGLQYTPFEVSTALHPGTISGNYEGYEVSITAREQYNRNALMVLTINLHQSLGLGLEMATSVLLRDQGITGQSPFSTGQQDLDKLFKPQARDPEAAIRLFKKNQIRDGIFRLLARGGQMGIYDDKLVYLADELATDFTRMRDLLELAVGAARAVEEASR